ncbi:hemagglutinin [Bifidobacterium samirii]|nr:hemagglutinin [Bifidobacterium samirii]
MTRAKQPSKQSKSQPKPSKTGRTGKAGRTGKSARKGRPFTGRIRRWWGKATPRQRAKAVVTTVVATLCVVALAVGATWLTIRRIEIDRARQRQETSIQVYDFDPGDIISDGQFFNARAMSEDEVQAFLDERGAACSGDRCLRNVTFDTEDRPADDYCEAAYEGADGERAAAIIDKSARACGISQKVLLTVLQKEQHLVTATDIDDFQYKSAMGLSCPDDASCDPEYEGFFRQVYGAAHRYRYYLAHEDDYGYHAGELNYVRYNPVASCGGSDVYIENRATALLYIYTPYQPNAAALEAGVGEGDSCSSYGNRNFSIIYQSWFGSPRR